MFCLEMTIYQGIGKTCFILVCECGYSTKEYDTRADVVREWATHLQEGEMVQDGNSTD